MQTASWDGRPFGGDEPEGRLVVLKRQSMHSAEWMQARRFYECSVESKSSQNRTGGNMEPIAQRLLRESKVTIINDSTPLTEATARKNATEEHFRTLAVLEMQYDDKPVFVYEDHSVIRWNSYGDPFVGRASISTKTVPATKFWDEFSNPLFRTVLSPLFHTVLSGAKNIRANIEEKLIMSREHLEQHLRTKGNFVILDFDGVSLKIISGVSDGNWFRLETVSLNDDGYRVEPAGKRFAQPLKDPARIAQA
jgi:hypothetical protein